MAMQILRYSALALVSICLVMIALVISGLVPLETVRDTIGKVPALVQVNTEKPVEVAKAGDPNTEGTKPATEDQTEVDTTRTSDEATVPVPADDAATGTSQADAVESETRQDESKTTDRVVPAFDVLRVEKDGSFVVAGRAAANNKIELRSGDGSLIGSGKTGKSGDFVVVPDKPLAAGDYSLSLVVINSEGEEIVSEETATVSIPDNDSGDVLAMITKPGEASRIIAKPETLQTDETEDETDKEDKSDTSGDTEVADSAGGESINQEAAGEESETKTLDEQTALPESATVEKDDDGQEQVQEKATAETGSGDEEQVATVLDQKSDDDTVETEAEISPAPVVRVEAVEVERDQIFIAGSATQGSTVRIYIDDKPVGEARGTSDDRFLVTRRYKLTPGQHKVRADSIDNATGKVIARAEVPLMHEPVEDVAADNTDDVDRTATGNQKAGPEASETEIAMAKTEDGGKPEDGPEDGDGSSVVVETDDTNSGGGTKTIDGSGSSNQKVTAKTPLELASENDQEQKTVKPSDILGSETSGSRQAKTESGDDKDTTDVATKNAVDTTKTTPVETLKPAKPEVVLTPEVTPKDPEIREPKEVVAAGSKDQTEDASDGTIRTGTSVIIKPGDNLWRISRKSYGRGIRYTTIYEANKDQIRNPHLIYIGQIFKIPDRPDEELVEADG